MKDKKIKDTIKSYQIPQIPDSVIDETVDLAKMEFERTPIQYKMPFKDVLIGQIKYISPYTWIVQAAILLIVSCFLLLSTNGINERQTIITILSVAAPIIALVGIPELAKSFSYNMWELESTSKFNLQKLVVIRLMIIGLIDLSTITIIVMATCTFYEISFVNVMLYILVPFSLSNSIYLFLLRKFQGKTVVFSCLIVGLIIAIALGFLSMFNMWYALTSTFIWIILFTFSVSTLAHEIIRLLKSIQRREELLWNYQ